MEEKKQQKTLTGFWSRTLKLWTQNIVSLTFLEHVNIFIFFFLLTTTSSDYKHQIIFKSCVDVYSWNDKPFLTKKSRSTLFWTQSLYQQELVKSLGWSVFTGTLELEVLRTRVVSRHLLRHFPRSQSPRGPKKSPRGSRDTERGPPEWRVPQRPPVSRVGLPKCEDGAKRYESTVCLEKSLQIIQSVTAEYRNSRNDFMISKIKCVILCFQN